MSTTSRIGANKHVSGLTISNQHDTNNVSSTKTSNTTSTGWFEAGRDNPHSNRSHKQTEQPTQPKNGKVIRSKDEISLLKEELEDAHYPKPVRKKIIKCFENNLTELNLSQYRGNKNQPITTIPPQTILSRLNPQLKTLNLSNTKIYHIKKDSFAVLDKLEELDLSNNNFNIENGAFAGLSNLQILKLKKTGFVWVTMINDRIINPKPGLITNEIFKGLDSLHTLDLSSAKITYIGRGAFVYLRSLERLDLSNNNINKIENPEFEGLTRLKELNLSNNKINNIQNGAFAGLSNLQKLNLSNNEINTIEPGTFAGLSSIESIDLTGNPIKEIKKDIFSDLKNLKTVMLGGEIMEFEYNAFDI